MIKELHAGLDTDERAFLISLARGKPEWQRLGVEHVAELPGVRWKLANLERLAKDNPKKFDAQARDLESILGKG